MPGLDLDPLEDQLHEALALPGLGLAVPEVGEVVEQRDRPVEVDLGQRLRVGHQGDDLGLALQEFVAGEVAQLVEVFDPGQAGAQLADAGFAGRFAPAGGALAQPVERRLHHRLRQLEGPQEVREFTLQHGGLRLRLVALLVPMAGRAEVARVAVAVAAERAIHLGAAAAADGGAGEHVGVLGRTGAVAPGAAAGTHGLHLVPERAVDDRLVLAAGIRVDRAAARGDVADVGHVAHHLVDALLTERPAAAAAVSLRVQPVGQFAV
ncbi:MAG: hypothetical protein WD404_05175 [Solirubrobacterales bacterium]